MEKRLKVQAVKIRLSDDLYAQLSRWAKINHRSKNLQVEQYVEDGIRRDEAQATPFGSLAGEAPQRKKPAEAASGGS